MKFSGINTNRDRDPLMKDLHEVGLKHGVMLVALAVPMDGSPLHSFFIDHKDDTTPEHVAAAFESAGVFLIKASEAIVDGPQKKRRRRA